MAGSTPSASKKSSEVYVLYDREMGVTLHESRLPGYIISLRPFGYAFRLTVSLLLFPKSLSN